MSAEEPDYKELYEDKIRQDEQWAKWRKEAAEEKKFARWFYILFFGYIIIGLYACGPSDSEYGPGCYDADPTQYVDVYCE